jgi:hypothetical protein
MVIIGYVTGTYIPLQVDMESAMITLKRRQTMSRLSKAFFWSVLVVFILACNMVSQPIKDVQNVAGTAESLATSMPNVASTIEAATTNMPDMALTVEAAGTELPDIGQMFDPQGAPVPEWKGIPIMSQATAGQEFADTNSYSFKAGVTVQEVQDYYKAQLEKLGWSSTISLPGSSDGAVMLFSKDSNGLTITITSSNGETVVVLTLITA